MINYNLSLIKDSAICKKVSFQKEWKKSKYIYFVAVTASPPYSVTLLIPNWRRHSLTASQPLSLTVTITKHFVIRRKFRLWYEYSIKESPRFSFRFNFPSKCKFIFSYINEKCFRFEWNRFWVWNEEIHKKLKK